MGDGVNHPYCYNVGNLAGRGLTVNLNGKRFESAAAGRWAGLVLRASRISRLALPS